MRKQLYQRRTQSLENANSDYRAESIRNKANAAVRDSSYRICHFVPVQGTAAYRSGFKSRVIPRSTANSSHSVINLCCFRRKISLSQQGELFGGHSQIVFFEPGQINLNCQNDLFLNG